MYSESNGSPEDYEFPQRTSLSTSESTSMTSPTALLMLPSELIEAILIYSHLWRELFLTVWDDPRPALQHRSLVDPRIDPAAWDWGTEYRRRVSADKWLKAWRRDICPADDETGKGAVEWYTTALSALSAVLSTLLTLRPFPATPPIALTVLTPAISPYPTGNIAGSGLGDRRERLTSAPPLPPLLIVLASGVRVGRVVYGPHASRALDSDQQAAELTPIPIPTPSLPPQLVRTLLASHAIGVRGLSAHVPFFSGADYWGDDALGDVFHRIICITGFVPIPPPLVSTPTPTSTSTATATTTATATATFTSDSDSDYVRSASVDMEVQKSQHDTGNELGTQEDGKHHNHCECDEQPMDRNPMAFPTPSQQHADARTLARSKVYDMRYIHGDRLWGPFHPVTRESLGECPGSSSLDVDQKGRSRKGGKHASTSGAGSGHGEAYHLGTLAWAMGVDIEPDDFDSMSDDTKDEDWRDPTDTSKESSSSSRSGDHEREQTKGGEDTVDADPDAEIEPIEPEHPLISLILPSTVTTDTESTTNSTTSSRRTRRSNPRLPPNSSVSPCEIKPQHLRPDYAYLASVRIVAEANLRDLLGAEISDNVERTASEVRVGGVGMFWEDEDEILRTQAGSSEPASSLSSASSSPPTTPSGIPAANTSSTTFDLADILSRGWIKREQSAMRSIDENADAFASSSEGNIGPRKPQIAVQQAQLEKPIEGTFTTEDKGKGKEKDGKSTVVPALGTGLGDWEIGPESEVCEGWDWAGVTGIWR
ncbi:hypothetical protein J3R83DRAFT_9543 [Lanmaoa asiatica]|nr:hypothetical protein J3R83DRAFT_9543 [Lanmaoa asiatica]